MYFLWIKWRFSSNRHVSFQWQLFRTRQDGRFRLDSDQLDVPDLYFAPRWCESCSQWFPWCNRGDLTRRPYLTIEAVTIWISNLHVLGSYIGKKFWNSDEKAVKSINSQGFFPALLWLEDRLSLLWGGKGSKWYYVHKYITYRYNTLNTSILKNHLSHPPKHKLCEGANVLGHIFLRFFIDSLRKGVANIER